MSAGNDIYQALRYGQTLTWDGQGGTDTLFFDSRANRGIQITLNSSGAINVDSISGASSYHFTLKNVERVDYQGNVIDANGQSLTKTGSYYDLTSLFPSAFTPAANQNPTVKAITKVVAATEGKAFSYSLPNKTFTDPEGGTLIYSASNKPDWLSIDSATGKLIGTPSYAAADSGLTSVVFVATDSGGLTATTTLTIKLTNTATIKGTANSETIVAGLGVDKITGLAGDDTITGGAGNDTISGGVGNDTLTGGSGNDYFLFDKAANATSNLDTITDFVSGADKLQFSKKVFAGLGKAAGSLTDAQFAYSTESLTTTDRIIYNTSTGALYYDVDGIGAVNAIQVAIIGTPDNHQLLFSDLLIVA